MHSSGTPVVEALESFYRRDIDDLAGWARRTLDAGTSRGEDARTIVDALNAGDFLEVYLSQLRAVPMETWAKALPLPDGHLRAALLARELVAVPASGRRNLFMDGRHYGAERMPGQLSPDYRELKAPLCYAHDVVLEDPFDDEHDPLTAARTIRETFPEAQIALAPDPDTFVRTIEVLADLAPLIRTGVVIFIPRQLTADPDVVAVKGSNLVARMPGLAERDLAERTLRAWLLTGGRAVPLFASPDEEQAFRDTAGLLADLVPEAESERMHRLATLALPSSGRLEIRRMDEIRHEDVFTRFRARQRMALAAVGDGEDEETRRAYREEMRAAAEEVNTRSARGALAEITLPKAVGWATGTLAASAAGWRAALAAVGALTAESVVEAWQDRERQARQALHHHYATLALPPTTS